MVKSSFILLVIILLTSCNQQPQILTSADLPRHSSSLIEKSGVPKIVTSSDERIYTVEASMYSFVGIYEWFDDDTVLYLTDENGISIVHKLNVRSGMNEIFFEVDDPITRIEANPDYSVFVIEVSTIEGERELHFVDKNGRKFYTVSNDSEEIQLYWNSFTQNELIIAALQTDYSIKLNVVNLSSKKITNFQFEHYYFQWLNEEELVYLKWDQFAPSYYAPLFKYNTVTEQEVKLADDVISFFAFNHYLLTVSVENNNAKESEYIIFDTLENSEKTRFKVPILRTYSEQWWIPNHAFDLKNENFFYFEPNTNGDLFQYSDGYKLMSYQLKSGKKTEITASDENYPLKISPSGRWLLYGYQLENIVDLKRNEISSLVYW